MYEVSIQIRGSSVCHRDFFKDGKIEVGSEIEISKGVSIRIEKRILCEAIDVPQIINLSLIIAHEYIQPVVLGMISAWLYDRTKKGKDNEISINGVQVEVDKEKILELLRKEIKEKSALEKHVISLSLLKIPKEELRQSASSLSERPISFDGKELPFPDNKVEDAHYDSGKIQITLFLRDELLNAFFGKEVPLYATVQTAEAPRPQNPIFIGLTLSSKRTPSSRMIEKYQKEDEIKGK